MATILNTIGQNATATQAGLVTLNKWQRKFLPSNITVSTTDISSLRFSNLVVGKVYAVSGQSIVNGNAAGSAFYNGSFAAIHNGVVIALTDNVYVSLPQQTNHYLALNRAVFVAAATTVTFNFGHSNMNLYGDGTTAGTYVQIEELNNYEQTASSSF